MFTTSSRNTSKFSGLRQLPKKGHASEANNFPIARFDVWDFFRYEDDTALRLDQITMYISGANGPQVDEVLLLFRVRRYSQLPVLEHDQNNHRCNPRAMVCEWLGSRRLEPDDLRPVELHTELAQRVDAPSRLSRSSRLRREPKDMRYQSTSLITLKGLRTWATPGLVPKKLAPYPADALC